MRVLVPYLTYVWAEWVCVILAVECVCTDIYLGACIYVCIMHQCLHMCTAQGRTVHMSAVVVKTRGCLIEGVSSSYVCSHFILLEGSKSIGVETKSCPYRPAFECRNTKDETEKRNGLRALWGHEVKEECVCMQRRLAAHAGSYSWCNLCATIIECRLRWIRGPADQPSHTSQDLDMMVDDVCIECALS